MNIKINRKTYIVSTTAVLILLTFFLLYEMGILTGIDPRDSRRMKDMKMIVSALEMYAHEHAGTFPESLDVLTNEKYLTERFADPVTAKPYAYVLDSEGNYSVCAHFIDLTQKCLYASPKKSGM